MFAHLFRNLSQWVGTAGCGALFSRAIALAAPQHPVLTGVRHRQVAPHLYLLADNAREYGTQATADAATTVLSSIVTILNGLIGEDITMSLLEDVPLRTHDTAPATDSETSPSLATRTDHGDVTS